MDTGTAWFAFSLVINLGIGASLGHWKGRIVSAVLLSLLLGPLGWIFVAIGPNFREKRNSQVCPACKAKIPKDAVKCMHCASVLADIPAQFLIKGYDRTGKKKSTVVTAKTEPEAHRLAKEAGIMPEQITRKI